MLNNIIWFATLCDRITFQRTAKNAPSVNQHFTTPLADHVCSHQPSAMEQEKHLGMCTAAAD